MRILLVEDEQALSAVVARFLTAQGNSVVVVDNGIDGLTEAQSGLVDAVLLDLTLPGMDGLEVLRRIRQRDPALPVIVLTARSALDQRVAGLDLGADDYLVKPFALAELGARLRSRVRDRNQPTASAITIGDLHIDLTAHRVHRRGEEIRLTAREFDLLVHLARHRGQVLSREQLLAAVWGYAYDGHDSRVLEVYVGYLRRKLGPPALIDTVRQVGYRLRDRD